jgi:hypothetical protein
MISAQPRLHIAERRQGLAPLQARRLQARVLLPAGMSAITAIAAHARSPRFLGASSRAQRAFDYLISGREIQKGARTKKMWA